jgi:hypothetical protein
MTEPKGYNGWTNWETWNANLWVMNTESVYRALKHTQFPHVSNVRDAQEFFLSNFPQGTPDMSDDPTAIFRINWEELLNAWNED